MTTSLDTAILARSTPIIFPDGNEGRSISLTDVKELSDTFGQPGWKIEARALRLDIHPTRYLRNTNQISTTDQIRLLESSVAQVGLGGLGGTLFEILLRTGIGRIRAADGDTFEESNLNRQTLATPETLGMPKAEAAKKRANLLNPSIETDCRNKFLTPDTLADFLSDCDVAIDALGGLADRLALQQAAATAQIPLITGALAGWTGYVSVVMPGQSGPADLMGHNNSAEETLGCSAPAVTCFASLMATEIVKTITKKATTDNSILIVDLATLTFERVTL